MYVQRSRMVTVVLTGFAVLPLVLVGLQMGRLHAAVCTAPYSEMEDSFTCPDAETPSIPCAMQQVAACSGTEIVAVVGPFRCKTVTIRTGDPIPTTKCANATGGGGEVISKLCWTSYTCVAQGNSCVRSMAQTHDYPTYTNKNC